MTAPLRVLLAEDDSAFRQLIAQTLRDAGHDVDVAADGGRLLVELMRGRRFDYQHVDLLVSDIQMPVCTGLQIVEALRAVHCKVPVILMTAFSDAKTRTKAERVGAVLLDKPFALDELRREVARFGGTHEGQ